LEYKIRLKQVHYIKVDIGSLECTVYLTFKDFQMNG